MEGFKENGPVEIGAALAYLASALCVIAIGLSGRASSLRYALGAAVLLLTAFGRELDMNVRLVSGSMTRSAYYVDPNVPLLERLAVVVLLLSIAGVATYLLREAWRGRFRKATVVVVGIAVAILVFAKTIDGAGRKLESFGIELTATANDAFSAVEETAEFAAPLMLLFLSVAVLVRRAKAN